MTERHDIQDERKKLYRARTKYVELQVKAQERELMPVSVAIATLERIVGAFRSRILAIPPKLAPIVISCKTPQEAKHEIQSEIHEVLSELTRIDFGEYGKKTCCTTTGADGKRVGRSKPYAQSRIKRRTRKVEN